jgi:hypothetical protein
MGTVFVGSWSTQFIAGRSAYNSEQIQDLQAPLTWAQCLHAPDFWNRTFQNWQSEFLAVATMAPSPCAASSRSSRGRSEPP